MSLLLPLVRRLGAIWFCAPLLRVIHRPIVWLCERYIQAWTAHDIRAHRVDVPDEASAQSGPWRLAWLFNSSPSNRGLLRMDFDEAAALYTYCACLENGVVVELGRYKGGSTILISSALGHKVSLVSIDSTPQDDAALSRLLRKVGTSERVELIRGYSSATLTSGPIRLVFIDADHAYDGVTADVVAWGQRLEPGGYLIFHDAARARWNATSLQGSRRLTAELRGDDHYVLEREVGSLACFRRR